jgi:tagaturonate reductase
MNLSGYTLKNIPPGKVIVPDQEIFDLPEKVLQFGTGMLLRGLPDYFIDKANRIGIFNGRVVAVKTTSVGDTAVFNKQDSLYTLCVRGIKDGQKVEENIINSAISRVLDAQHEWERVLECAHNQNLQVVISNTTETGIRLVNDDISRHPPLSFPGKLLAFLFERFKAFNRSEYSGLVIVPTELIPDNGSKLESIVLELAHLNGMEDAFIDWLERCNHFCNSLVDRIVTGIPAEPLKNATEDELGYKDQLITFCEAYRLWAIEGDKHTRKILSFAEADDSMIIQPDIDLYRELKLRLLNGTHTLCCGIAVLAGADTVKEAMDDEVIGKYAASLMQQEIAPSIPYKTDPAVRQLFIEKVRDRFQNPYINHYWQDIANKYSNKMKIRCLPLLRNYYDTKKTTPQLFATGFAAYFYYLKAVRRDGNKYFGESGGKSYLIEDELAAKYYTMWQNLPVHALVEEALANVAFWEEDLSDFPGFAQAVGDQLNSIMRNGMRAALKNIYSGKNLADTL